MAQWGKTVERSDRELRQAVKDGQIGIDAEGNVTGASEYETYALARLLGRDLTYTFPDGRTSMYFGSEQEPNDLSLGP